VVPEAFQVDSLALEQEQPELRTVEPRDQPLKKWTKETAFHTVSSQMHRYPETAVPDYIVDIIQSLIGHGNFRHILRRTIKQSSIAA